MASTTTIIFDRCGQVVLADRTLLRIESGPLRNQHECIDLCKTCQGLLVSWLATEAAAEPAPAIGGV